MTSTLYRKDVDLKLKFPREIKLSSQQELDGIDTDNWILPFLS